MTLPNVNSNGLGAEGNRQDEQKGGDVQALTEALTEGMRAARDGPRLTADERSAIWQKLNAARAALSSLALQPVEPPWRLSDRCKSIGPAPRRFRCGLPSGHEEEHTALIETGAPWFAPPPAVPAQPAEVPPAQALVYLRAIFEEMDDNDSEAPGHAHSRRGVWDDGAKAGTICRWCWLWNDVRAFLALLDQPQALDECPFLLLGETMAECIANGHCGCGAAPPP